MDIDPDDYGELIRFWLQARTGEQGSITTKLADKLHLTITAIGYWIRGQRDIPEKHWRVIAQHFNLLRPTGMTPLDALIVDARRRWATPENQRYYMRRQRPRRPARRTAA